MKKIESFDDLFEYIDGSLSVKKVEKKNEAIKAEVRLRNEDRKEIDFEYLFENPKMK